MKIKKQISKRVITRFKYMTIMAVVMGGMSYFADYTVFNMNKFSESEYGEDTLSGLFVNADGVSFEGQS